MLVYYYIESKIITTKGRNFEIENFYSGVARFKFKDLCEKNLGAEDYINIANICHHIFIEEIPIFDDENSNQQLRFITLIDILYEKKIRLTLSLKENLKSSSYFKIRSGWLPFSFDLTINGLWDIDSTDQEQLDKLKNEEIKRKENFSNFQKGRIQNVYFKSFTNSNSDLNFILESKRYQFSNPELSYLGNDLVYVINCLPLRSDKFKATLYINSEDFAIVRLDYENVKPLSKFKLLGISLLEYLEKGRMRFSKLNNEKYDLSYFQSTKENKASINRPFKIIEKNKVVKGRNKQNQISAKLNLSIKI